jgi:hypothetical protein
MLDRRAPEDRMQITRVTGWMLKCRAWNRWIPAHLAPGGLVKERLGAAARTLTRRAMDLWAPAVQTPASQAAVGWTLGRRIAVHWARTSRTRVCRAAIRRAMGPRVPVGRTPVD